MLLFRKAQGQQSTMKMTTKTGEAVAQTSVSLNCVLSNHFKSAVTEYSPNFNGKHMKGALWTLLFVGFPFFTRVINPTTTPSHVHTHTHTHTQMSNPCEFWKQACDRTVNWSACLLVWSNVQLTTVSLCRAVWFVCFFLFHNQSSEFTRLDFITIAYKQKISI